jgi:hypothetical protein
MGGQKDTGRSFVEHFFQASQPTRWADVHLHCNMFWGTEKGSGLFFDYSGK